LIAVDTSALICVAFEEPEAEDFLRIINTQDCLLGGPTLFETHLVLRQRLPRFPLAFLEHLVQRPNIDVVAFTSRHAALAREAFDRFGRGRHPAALNYGDCMCYAIAKDAGVPLLFKGADFSKTDIASVGRHG
jgi:ribonuclease VapC